MTQERKAHVEGNGAIAQDGSVAAGAGGVAVGRDVHGPVVVAGEGAQVTVTYQGIKVVIPSSEAVTSHRAALRDRLERDARARWGGMSTYIQEEGATLPVEASPYQTGRLGPRENLLTLLRAADRLLVLGEPSSGKTVALERLAWELCDEEEQVVPVLVPLSHYAGTPLTAWVRAILRKTGHLRLDDERALEAFLEESEARCLFLFDGLNEVAPPYRDRLVEELVLWMTAHRRHSVILTSRPQDDLWQRLRGEVGRAVVVQPIGDDQVQAYLVEHLDEKGGIEMVLIPAGEFLMGSTEDDRMADNDERPQHTLYLPDYYIARTLVTNEQYARFVEQNPERRPIGAGWRFTKPPSDRLEDPVVGVSWYDALAYCEWLKQTGRTYRLPTEAEWEKAARGADGRLFPWGDELTPHHCDCDSTGITPVDRHEKEPSPYGCYVVVGNIREWTSTLWGEDWKKAQFTYPYRNDGREDPSAPSTVYRICRGRAYDDDASRLGCSARSHYAPNARDRNLGFRVVLEV